MKRFVFTCLFGAVFMLTLHALNTARLRGEPVAARQSAPAPVEKLAVEPATRSFPEDVSPQVEELIPVEAQIEPVPKPHTEVLPGENDGRTLAQARTDLWQILLRTDSIRSTSLEDSASDRALEEAVAVDAAD